MVSHFSMFSLACMKYRIGDVVRRNGKRWRKDRHAIQVRGTHDAENACPDVTELHRFGMGFMGQNFNDNMILASRR